MLQDPNNELNLLQTDGSSATADSEKVTSEASHWLSMRAVDVLDNTTDAFIALDSEWRILFANRTACAINKKPLSDFVGRTHWEEWPASVGTVVEENYRRAAADQVDVHFTHHYSNAEYDVWLEIDAYPLPDGLNVFYRDITAKHQSDRLVEESERKFRALADNIAQLAWMADGTGSIFWYNQRWYDYTGTTFEQMQGWGWDKVHRPDLLPGIIERFKACLESGAVWEDTFPLLSSDGVYNWFLSRAFPIFDASGKVVLRCGTCCGTRCTMEAGSPRR